MAPTYVTDVFYQFYLDFKAFEPAIVLGGFYADKPGYHNIPKNLSKGDYSLQLAADRAGPPDKCAAVDFTFPAAQTGSYDLIAKYASRLLNSGLDPNDPRGNGLREFYGQADGDRDVEGWDFQKLVRVTSDSSHLWHIHISVLRNMVNSKECMRDVLSILKGETVAQWRASINPPTTPPQEDEDVAVSADLAAALDDVTWRIDALFFDLANIRGGRLVGDATRNHNSIHDRLQEILTASKSQVNVPALAAALAQDSGFVDALATAVADKLYKRLES